jgi:hypothetical protein
LRRARAIICACSCRMNVSCFVHCSADHCIST